MKYIEIQLPNKPATIVAVDRIASVAFQKDKMAPQGAVFISIDGWQKPLVVEGEKAEKMFISLKEILKPEVLIF